MAVLKSHYGIYRKGTIKKRLDSTFWNCNPDNTSKRLNSTGSSELLQYTPRTAKIDIITIITAGTHTETSEAGIKQGILTDELCNMIFAFQFYKMQPTA